LSTLPAIRAGRASSLAGLAGAAAFGAFLGLVLASHPPSGAVVAAGVLGVGAMLALAVASYEAAIALGFLLLGVVRVEPAPSDMLLAVVAAVAVATGRLELRRVPGPMLALLVVLLALNVVSMAAAAELGEALRFFAITLYLVVLAIWLTSYLRGPTQMRLVIGAYVAGAVASAALAVAALFVAYPGHELLTGEGATRARGLFKDPNVFGPFLVPAALILLEESLRPRLLGLRRTASAALLVVLVLGIVFAYSRAGWLNLAVAVAAMLLVMSLRTDAARAATAAVALVAVVAAFGGAAVVLTGSTGFLQERAQVQAYDTARFSAQRTGVQLASEHVLGVGPGQFEHDQPVSAHSIYVRVLAEQGVLGLAALVALLVGTLVLAVRNALAGRDAYGVGSAALLGAWCGLLANSAFVDTLHWRHLWLVAALVWAAAMRSARRA
jgi:O-antigen ligase